MLYLARARALIIKHVKGIKCLNKTKLRGQGTNGEVFSKETSNNEQGDEKLQRS